MTRRTLACLLLAAGLAGAAEKPKLILTIVVDQFRYDYLQRFSASYTGGLARLLKQGAVFTNAYYIHFPTVTAIGHATVLSGALPALSGIVGNEWYDRELGKQVTSVSDDTVKVLGAPGRGGASPSKLLVSTVGDELKMSGGKSKVIGMSIKDRAAILPVGRMADGAYWFDNSAGNFVSSTWYFNDLPKWANEFNREHAVDKYLGAQWTPAEGGKAFRTMATKPDKAYYGAMERTPYGSEILEAFAERAIEGENLGRNGGTDLLSVSFSSNDYVGHGAGPDAPEVRDISIRTDRILERLFSFVDKTVGMKNVLVVFTADHGVAPMPELMKQRKMPGGRVPEDAVLNAINQRLVERYGDGQWVIGKSGPAPYFDYNLIRSRNLKIEDVQNEAADAVRDLPYILRVYTKHQLTLGLALDGPIDQRVRAGFQAHRASDLFIVAKPYWLFEKSGTSHGTPFNYDTHVPIVFMGANIKPGRYNGRVAVNDIAPTLATICDVETPSGAAGRVLDEMLIEH